MARFELAQLDDRTGQGDEAVKLYQELIDKPSMLVPKPVVMLALAEHYGQSNPTEAAKLYNQIKIRVSGYPHRRTGRIRRSPSSPENPEPRMTAMPLAAYAMDVRRTRGRRYPERQHPYRNDFARDRDRVIHARAFRRLEAKTQVFTTRFSDHFRNRLTHTLEVAQIARTVSGALHLNTDLAEALALVHDIGHPPFGHAGERQLDVRMREYGDRFDHNLHALRIVEQFEQSYLDFPGLNLTFEVREGIIKHSRDYFRGGVSGSGRIPAGRAPAARIAIDRPGG